MPSLNFPGFPSFVEKAKEELGLEINQGKVGVVGGPLREIARLAGVLAESSLTDAQRDDALAAARKARNTVAAELLACDQILRFVEEGLGLAPTADDDSSPVKTSPRAAKAKPAPAKEPAK